MVKQRSPMQVSDAFEKALKQLQSDFMRQEGRKISFRDLTEKIVKAEDFKKIEDNILKKVNRVDIKIALDRRIR